MVIIFINQSAKSALLLISSSNILIAKKHEFHQYLGIFLSTDGLFKAITEKQFLYLVSMVLQPIVNYNLIRRNLKLKANLSRDFPNKALYYLKLYGLRTFVQSLSENLMANFINFTNADGILDLMNCFLTSITCTLVLCNVSLSKDLFDVFYAKTGASILNMLNLDIYSKVVCSFKRYNVIFVGQLLDHYGFLAEFIANRCPPIAGTLVFYPGHSNCSFDFNFICQYLLISIEVYTDGSVKDIGLIGTCSGTAAYFPAVNIGVSVRVHGLLLLILAELHTIALALDYVPVSCTRKVKSYFDVVENKHVNFYISATIFSHFFLPLKVPCYFLNMERRPVSGNVHYFVRCLFDSVSFVGWESRCVDNIMNMCLDSSFNMQNLLWFYVCIIGTALILFHKDSASMFACNQEEEIGDLVDTSANSGVVVHSLYKAEVSDHLYTMLAKNFVLRSWVTEALCILGSGSSSDMIVRLVYGLAEHYRTTIWLPTVKLRFFYKKLGLLPHDGVTV
ncbi:hypothetical protein G9A89_009117 [Geosiphon pyriformis]|nr:hypothetical protein G9A89_009117 [Geosiphon pyriformis]